MRDSWLSLRLDPNCGVAVLGDLGGQMAISAEQQSPGGPDRDQESELLMAEE